MTKLIFTLTLAGLFFLMAMINMRPPEHMGVCVINGVEISPVSNLDCEGEFNADK